MGLVMPVVVGTAGLGVEEGFWLYRHHLAQSAADASAISAATAYGASSTANITSQADGVAAQYGFVSGAAANATLVTVNRPPKTGTHQGNANYIEVLVQEKRPRMLSAIFGGGTVTIGARAVAQTNAGLGCLLALDGTASAAGNLQGNPVVTLTNCSAYDNSNNATALNVGGSASMSALSVSVVGNISGAANITTTKGITTGALAVSDPYASTNYPSYEGCDYNNITEKNTATINPGVYCNGLKLNAGANVTMNQGIYYLDRGTLSINGGATLTGNGVTLVFTSSTGSNYATASINGGATVSLIAPTTGSTAGIVMFGDRTMPLGTSFSLNGGSGQGFGGAVYLPKASLAFAGGANANAVCTEVIADTVSFVGNSTLAVNCTGYATKPIGNLTASLAE